MFIQRSFMIGGLKSEWDSLMKWIISALGVTPQNCKPPKLAKMELLKSSNFKTFEALLSLRHMPVRKTTMSPMTKIQMLIKDTWRLEKTQCNFSTNQVWESGSLMMVASHISIEHPNIIQISAINKHFAHFKGKTKSLPLQQLVKRYHVSTCFNYTTFRSSKLNYLKSAKPHRSAAMASNGTRVPLVGPRTSSFPWIPDGKKKSGHKILGDICRCRCRRGCCCCCCCWCSPPSSYFKDQVGFQFGYFWIAYFLQDLTFWDVMSANHFSMN